MPINNYLDIPEDIRTKTDRLYDLISKSPINVTAIKDRNEYELKHILDSIWFFNINNIHFNTLGDIGSGGGFPGIIIALFYPESKITLIESIAKKCFFLEKTITELELKNVSILNKRVESIERKEIEGNGFDIITARGVTTVKKILYYTEKISLKSTKLLLYKGEKLGEEINAARNEINARGLKHETIRIERPFTRSYFYMYP